MSTLKAIKITGTKKLKSVLERIEQQEKVKAIVKKHAADLQRMTQQNMAQKYTGHYEGTKFARPTGNTRRNTMLAIENGGTVGRVYVNTNYFAYLEYGTRFMSARPTLGPAYRTVRPLFISDLKKLLS